MKSTEIKKTEQQLRAGLLHEIYGPLLVTLHDLFRRDWFTDTRRYAQPFPREAAYMCKEIDGALIAIYLGHPKFVRKKGGTCQHKSPEFILNWIFLPQLVVGLTLFTNITPFINEYTKLFPDLSKLLELEKEILALLKNYQAPLLNSYVPVQADKLISFAEFKNEYDKESFLNFRIFKTRQEIEERQALDSKKWFTLAQVKDYAKNKPASKSAVILKRLKVPLVPFLYSDKEEIQTWMANEKFLITDLQRLILEYREQEILDVPKFDSQVMEAPIFGKF